MTKRLLIDASHAEETRVVVLDGNRLEDFDVETQSRRQLKGNIYLAKIVRVEPSLQAAFVEYGGNRHGFLAFGEIHPDYYQIPVADRQRLLAMQEEEARAEEDAEDDEPVPRGADIADEPGMPEQAGGEQAGGPDGHPGQDESASGPDEATDAAQDGLAGEASADRAADEPDASVQTPSPPISQDAAGTGEPAEGLDAEPDQPGTAALLIADDAVRSEAFDEGEPQQIAEPSSGEMMVAAYLGSDTLPEAAQLAAQQEGNEHGPAEGRDRVRQVDGNEALSPESIGGEHETGEETRAPRQPSRFMRSYKIQEVIRRRQILLIQVVKEERGTKGAALTTYISLAGRYCVLMPNSPRGGGISRKITSAADRRRLKEVTTELDVPRGMGLIVRTAGAARPKPEIKRDGEYLLRLWDDIREKTLASMAPAMIHEEASLIKRTIRDVYSRDVDELLVDGIEGWRAARDYMRMLMPTHVKKVQLWPANAQPLFANSQVESLLDAMLNPTVQLRSGGYLVINQTEALVAIDVNSGRSTRERGIEETALRTNLEAAEEAARQLRLRDLAGLIVIDFIDMESKKHNAMVERRIADALRHDRARIQLGHISHFGLLELSRQRLRPSLAETSLNVCAQCGGSGHVRSTESAALHVLREIEEVGGKRTAAEIQVHVASSTALYILNNKRERLTEIEARYAMRVCFAPDESLLPAQTRIDRLRAAVPQDAAPQPVAQPMPEEDILEADIAEDEDDVVFQSDAGSEPARLSPAPAGEGVADADQAPGETAAEGEQRGRKRRRRRRGGRREDGASADIDASAAAADGAVQPDIFEVSGSPQADERPDTDGQPAAPEPGFADRAVLPVPGHDEASEAVVETALSEPAMSGRAATTAPGETMAETATDAPAVEAARGETVAETALSAPAAETAPGAPANLEPAPPAEADGEPARAKRGRRGGRRRRKPGEGAEQDSAEAETPLPLAPPEPDYVPYSGPTPANPFAMTGLDIFDALEQAELQPASRIVAEAPQPPQEMDTPEPAMEDFGVVAENEQPPASGPAVAPVLIGSAEVTSPAKKGWWRK